MWANNVTFESVQHDWHICCSKLYMVILILRHAKIIVILSFTNHWFFKNSKPWRSQCTALRLFISQKGGRKRVVEEVENIQIILGYKSIAQLGRN